MQKLIREPVKLGFQRLGRSTLPFQLHRMLNAGEAVCGASARALEQHLLQWNAWDQRIDEGTAETLGSPFQGGEGDRPLLFCFLHREHSRLGYAYAAGQLGGGHAERFADSSEPTSWRTSELLDGAQRRQPAIQMFPCEAIPLHSPTRLSFFLDRN